MAEICMVLQPDGYIHGYSRKAEIPMLIRGGQTVHSHGRPGQRKQLNLGNRWRVIVNARNRLESLIAVVLLEILLDFGDHLIHCQ
jgi:hypothetical protein